MSMSPEQQEWFDDRSDEALEELCVHLSFSADPSCWKAANIIRRDHGLSPNVVFTNPSPSSSVD